MQGRSGGVLRFHFAVRFLRWQILVWALGWIVPAYATDHWGGASVGAGLGALLRIVALDAAYNELHIPEEDRPPELLLDFREPGEIDTALVVPKDALLRLAHWGVDLSAVTLRNFRESVNVRNGEKRHTRVEEPITSRSHPEFAAALEAAHAAASERVTKETSLGMITYRDLHRILMKHIEKLGYVKIWKGEGMGVKGRVYGRERPTILLTSGEEVSADFLTIAEGNGRRGLDQNIARQFGFNKVRIGGDWYVAGSFAFHGWGRPGTTQLAFESDPKTPHDIAGSIQHLNHGPLGEARVNGWVKASERPPNDLKAHLRENLSRLFPDDSYAIGSMVSIGEPRYFYSGMSLPANGVAQAMGTNIVMVIGTAAAELPLTTASNVKVIVHDAEAAAKLRVAQLKAHAYDGDVAERHVRNAVGQHNDDVMGRLSRLADAIVETHRITGAHIDHPHLTQLRSGRAPSFARVH